MQEFLVGALFFLSLVFLAMPILYTCFRLTKKIRPDDATDAVGLGVIFYFIGFTGFAILLYNAVNLSLKINTT